jgi:hypothetical protein
LEQTRIRDNEPMLIDLDFAHEVIQRASAAECEGLPSS